MSYRYFLSLTWLILSFCVDSVLWAQTIASQDVRLGVEQREAIKGDRTFPFLLKVENFRDQRFRGFIRWDADGAFHSLKGDSLFIDVDANQQHYLSLRLISSSNAKAGKNKIKFTLWDDETKMQIQETTESISLKEKVQLLVRARDEEIIVSNSQDSVGIALYISNNGNTPQDLELIYNFPTPINGSTSFVRRMQLAPERDSSITFRFLMPPSLRETNEFRIHVTAVGGTSKQVLGHSNIIVKNLRSSRSYGMHDNDQTLQFHHLNNGINFSRRQQGDLTSYQLYGGGSVNLKAGMLALNGNLSYNTVTDEFYASGTTLQYGLNNLGVELGSISTDGETNLFGRGIKINYHEPEQQQTYSIGIIDNQFNVLSPEKLFTRGYSIFGEAVLGTNNLQKQWKGQFAFKQDPYEDFQSQLLSVQLKRTISPSYSVEIRGHSALSQYKNLQRNRADGAFEFIQRGRFKTWNWSGNYFFSSDYFPGTRRGTWFITHTVNKQLDNNASLWGNFYFAHYTPKSYTFNYDYRNRNIRGELGIRLPRWKQINPGMRLQVEQEKSDNQIYQSSLSGEAKIQSVRAIEDISWQSTDHKHAVYLSLENGLVQYPFISDWRYQARGTLTYSFAGLQAMVNYQQGAYYLFEYLGNQNAQNQQLERLTLNTSYFRSFFQDRLQMNLGLGYYNDFQGNRNPSSYANIRYALTDRLHAFANSSWYEYSYNSNLKNQVTSVELGARLEFAKKSVSSKKKGRLEVYSFYDENSNDIWDEGELPAIGVTIAINHDIFISDANGRVRYTMLPYGSYTIRGGLKGNWYFKNYDVDLFSGAARLDIPLKQTGTLTGRVRYVFDENLASDVEAKYAGIVVILSREKFTKRLITDNEGNFSINLPKGKYMLQLDHATLPERVACENPTQKIEISTGKINNAPEFILNVENRKIRLKKFGGSTSP